MSKHAKQSLKRTESYRRRKPLNLLPGREVASTSLETTSQHEVASHQLSSLVEELVHRGIAAYQSQRLDDAAARLTDAIALDATHALAHNCLGIVRRAQGDVAAAIACYQRALQHAPDYAEAHNNLGVAWESRNECERAVEAYRAALRSRPRFAAAWNNLGNALTKLNRPQEAIDSLRKSLAEQPTFAAAHNNLGLAQSRVGAYEDAERSLRRAIELQGRFPEAHVNLGHVLRAKGNREQAVDAYRFALQMRPRYPAALSGLGNVLLDLRQLTDALGCFDEALRADANCAEAHFGRGSTLLELERWNEAESSFRSALASDPRYAEAWNNLGSTYRAMNRLDDAENAFMQAVTVDSDLVAAHNNLGNLYRLQERYDRAAAAYAEVLRRKPNMRLASLRLTTLCPTVFDGRASMERYLHRVREEWTALEGACSYRDLGELLTVANEPPYNLQFFSENIRSVKEAYARIFRYTGPELVAQPATGRIRIGCVVTGGHEVAFVRLIWDCLRQMNASEFELVILCAAESVNKMRAGMADSTTTIVPLPEQPQQVLEVIRGQHCEILYYFEICTDARNYFLPYFRLAPVQVTSWGIQVTSGIPHVDYYLSSDLIEAPEADEHYSETLVRARTLLTYQRRMTRPAFPRSRGFFGLSADEHLYICAQHLGKFHPDFDVILAEILRRDPRGRIVGTEDKYGYGAGRLRERWSRSIPDVAERIVLLPRLGQADYLSLLLAGDVLLDPLHFGGVSTTYDALSFDLPIVTLPTRHHRGRYTLGCYQRMGIYSCVAENEEGYVQLAIALGSDADRRAQVTAEIREQSWRVFEDAESVQEHERIFRELAHKAR